MDERFRSDQGFRMIPAKPKLAPVSWNEFSYSGTVSNIFCTCAAKRTFWSIVAVGEGWRMLNTTPWSSLGASSRWANMKKGTMSSVSMTAPVMVTGTQPRLAPMIFS